MDIFSQWEEMSIFTAFLVFIAYIIVDGAYAYYTLAVARRQPIRAATVGSLMHFLLAIGVLSYVQNYLYVIPLALGSWVGTYFVVKSFK